MISESFFSYSVLPAFREPIKIFEVVRPVSAAMLYVFADESLYENVDFHFEKLLVFYPRVGIKDFVELSFGDKRKSVRGENYLVGFTEHSVIIFVLAYIIEKTVDEFIYVVDGRKLVVVEEILEKLVFEILRDRVNVVVVRIKRASVDFRPSAKLADRDFSYLFLLAEHLREYALDGFPRFSGRAAYAFRFHNIPPFRFGISFKAK